MLKSHQAEIDKTLSPVKVHNSKGCGFFYANRHRRLVAAGDLFLEVRYEM